MIVKKSFIRLCIPVMLLGCSLAQAEGSQWLDTSNGLINLSRVTQISSFASNAGMILKFDGISLKVDDSEEIVKIEAERKKAQGAAAETLAVSASEKRVALLQEKIKKIVAFLQSGEHYLKM